MMAKIKNPWKSVMIPDFIDPSLPDPDTEIFPAWSGWPEVGDIGFVILKGGNTYIGKIINYSSARDGIGDSQHLEMEDMLSGDIVKLKAYTYEIRKATEIEIVKAQLKKRNKNGSKQ